MSQLLDRIFDVPLSKSAREADMAARIGHLDDKRNIAGFATGIEHITNKSAALLQADSIFIAVALFALQSGLPRILSSVALVLLTTSCLLLASNLRSVWPRAPAGDDQAQFRLVYSLRVRRGLAFNFALYLFYAGVAVLAASAFV